MSSTFDTLVAHPARVALAAVEEGLGGLGEANLWTLSDAELLELRADLEATRARLDAQVLAATREVDGRGAAVATGAASTAAWLRHKLLLHPGAAKAEVALAKDLHGELTATGLALRSGEVTRDQAAAVAAAMRALPGGVDPATRRLAEHWMLGEAAQFDVAAMHRLGRHLVQVVDPERGAALERDEARHAARQELTLTHGADGSRRFRGQLGPEGGALLDAALAAVSGPRPAQDGTPDPRTPGQRRAEGLLELIGPGDPDRRDARARRRTGHPDRHHHPGLPHPDHRRRQRHGHARGDPGGRHPAVPGVHPPPRLRPVAGRGHRRHRPRRPGHRPTQPGHPPPDAPRPDRPRPRLRVPRLRPTAALVPRPPHLALGARRTHRTIEPRPALRATSPDHPPPRLGHRHRTRRPPPVLPTTVDRPHPNTPPTLATTTPHPAQLTYGSAGVGAPTSARPR